MDELHDKLALHRAGLAYSSLNSLLQKYGSARTILKADSQQLTQLGLSTACIRRLQQPDLAAIDKDLLWSEQSGNHILSLHDQDYPEPLRHIPQPPYLLYVIGDIEYLHYPQLAMVGSRTPTSAGRKIAENFAQELSDRGITITSGLARGIDGACHQGALQGLAGSVAVMANGLSSIYPGQHTQLASKIVQKGCLISETPLETPPHKGLFPKRNRIISGLSLGTLVVEAARNSGSLITARQALEQGRELFAIPGSIHNPLSRGCHSLIRQGAKLVETTEDILEELFPLVNLPSSRHTSGHTEQPKDETILDPTHLSLLECMDFEPIAIDDLVARSNMSAAKIASVLLILELEGQVISENGRYSRIRSQL